MLLYPLMCVTLPKFDVCEAFSGRLLKTGALCGGGGWVGWGVKGGMGHTVCLCEGVM